MKKFFGTKESAGCRSRPLAAFQTQDGKLQVTKSTIMDTFPVNHWVYYDGKLIGVITLWNDGGCWGRIAWEGVTPDEPVEYADDIVAVEFKGSGGLAMAVGAILAHHLKKS
jgi:hypothetical protein